MPAERALRRFSIGLRANALQIAGRWKPPQAFTAPVRADCLRIAPVAIRLSGPFVFTLQVYV